MHCSVKKSLRCETKNCFWSIECHSVSKLHYKLDKFSFSNFFFVPRVHISLKKVDSIGQPIFYSCWKPTVQNRCRCARTCATRRRRPEAPSAASSRPPRRCRCRPESRPGSAATGRPRSGRRPTKGRWWTSPCPAMKERPTKVAVFSPTNNPGRNNKTKRLKKSKESLVPVNKLYLAMICPAWRKRGYWLRNEGPKGSRVNKVMGWSMEWWTNLSFGVSSFPCFELLLFGQIF